MKITHILPLLFLMSLTASAQSDLFLEIGGDATGGSPPNGILAAYPVTVDVMALANNPTELNVEVPTIGTLIAARKDFVPIAGFDEKGIPLPDTTPADITLQWRGSTTGDEYIGIAIYQGATSGLVLAEGRSFSIGRQYISQDHLIDVDLSALPDDIEANLQTAPSSSRLSNGPFTISNIRHYPPQEALPAIRILFLYTDQARIDAGGLLGIPDDLAIIAMIYGTMADIAEVMANSNVDIAFQVAATALLEGFTPTGVQEQDLEALRTDLAIQATRDAYSADVISVILRNSSDDAGAPVDVCGWSYVQRPGCADPGNPPIPNCNPGPEFAPWAIHFSAVNCLRSKLVGVHELVHNFGGEHDRVFSVPPEDAIYPFAFGYYYFSTMQEDTFNTVMAIFPGSNFKIPYLSNPNVTHPVHNRPVGSEEANIARTVLLTAPAVEGFRGPPAEIIFIGDFESGGLTEWSSVNPEPNFDR